MDRLDSLVFTKTKHKALDREHEVFEEILKKIFLAYKENRGIEIKNGLIRELLMYIDFHFKSEENWMLLSNDPNYNKHKEEHQNIKELLSSIITVFDIEQVVLNELINFIYKRMIVHTNTFDYKLGQHLLKQRNGLI